jgi:hypothetical protein
MSVVEAIATRSSLHAYAGRNNGLPAQFTPDEVHFVIETGASITITNNKTDFLSEVQQIQPITIKGIASGLSVWGIGEVHWN